MGAVEGGKKGALAVAENNTNSRYRNVSVPLLKEGLHTQDKR